MMPDADAYGTLDSQTGMSMSVERYYSYREFCDYARRFNQVDLLTAIARTALALPDSVRDPRYRRTLPWALAALAKASICHGNAYRSTTVRPDTIARACQMYNNLAPEELDSEELKSALGILVRIAYEQFPYQEPLYGEIARAEAFFGCYSGRKRLEVLSDAALTQLLGAPLRQAVGVAFVLYASARVNNGFFDPAWMEQPQFTDVLATVPQGQIVSVINAVFANSFDDFKLQAAEAPPLPFLDRYMFNPLTARPFVRLGDGRLLAPVPQLIGRKLSPVELYYLGSKRWGNPFTNDMGHLFENYVGRQLQTLPDATVYPEIQYNQGKDALTGVDWIVVAKDAVLLVEAKATRVPAPARAGQATIKDTLKRTLGKAFDQINRTYQAIRSGVPEFSAIPTDRPFLGLVTTLDHWYFANSGLTRNLLPEPDIPTLVAWVGALEHLIAIGQRRTASTILAEILDDEDRRTWDLTTALAGYTETGDDNPVLRQAWKQYPFREEPDDRR
jgi:hypothetical protein